jgi:hypothetical protein
VAVCKVDFVESMAELREALLGRYCQDNRFAGSGQLGWAIDLPCMWARIKAFITGVDYFRVARNRSGSMPRPEIAYDRAVQGRIRDRFGKFHYTLAVRSCRTQIKRWREIRNITGQMQYVFDAMSQGKCEIIAALEYHDASGRAQLCGLAGC